jgi:hypothetical protein
MTDQFAVLPAPFGYQLIEIDENYGEGDIDRWLSAPVPVLGFVVRQQQHYFSVLPMTATAVYDDGGCGHHALIRPDGKIDFVFGGEYIFESIEDLKIHLLREAAELNREMASDCTDDRKQAADWRRHAKKLEDEARARAHRDF